MSPQQLWSLNQREGQDPYQVVFFFFFTCVVLITYLLTVALFCCFKVDMEYGIDCQDPLGHHLEGVMVPEVQLMRPLTEAELQRLPDPLGAFSSVLNVYMGSIEALSSIFENI